MAPEPQSESEGPPRTGLGIVFATILIDFIGFSVLFPVLPLYADRLGASPFQVGLILTLYALAQLLFLPLWGWVSDRIGRRPVLLVSLLGTALSFVLLALAQTVPAVYVARALSGFFAASIGTAQAVVTDVTPAHQRASGMGMIGAALGAGMVIGPMLGGGLAAIDESAPFIGMALLAGTNFVLAWARLPESRPTDLERPSLRDLAGSLVPAPLRLLLAVHERRIGLYLLLFFLMFTAFAVLESMITLYLGKRWGKGELDAALFFAWTGLFVALTQGVLLRRVVGRFGEVRLVHVGFGLMIVGIGAVAAVPTWGWLFVLGPVIAVGSGLAFPSFTSLYSKACRAEHAGELLGQSQSLATTGRVIAPLGAGWLMQSVGLGTPFVAGALLMTVALGVFLATSRELLGER